MFTNHSFVRRARVAVLLFCAGLVYLPFLGSPSFFDDIGLFGGISSYAELGAIFNSRGLPYFTHGATWVFFGEYIPVFRVGNLLLHAVNSWLVWKLLLVWMRTLRAGQEDDGKLERAAWWGALVFACHPLAVYAAGYLVQRTTLMATMFTLLMQLAYLRGLAENSAKQLALAVLAYLLAVSSKEHSLMAPMVLLPLTWLLRPGSGVTLRTLVIVWGGFLLVALVAVMRVKGVLGQVYEFDAQSLLAQQGATIEDNMHLRSILTQAGLFFKYCYLMLVPNPAWMSIDMREVFLPTWREWTNWIGLVAFLAYGAIALKLLLRGGRGGLLGLALLYPWSHFIVEFSSVRVQEIFVLYRTYLWLPGYALLFSLMIVSLPERRSVLAGILVLAMLIPAALNRQWVFADEYRIWNDAEILLDGKEPPGAARIYYGRGRASAAKQDWDAAIADYSRSSSIDRDNTRISLALATAYFGAQRYPEALQVIDGVIGKEPDNAKAYYNKGILLRKTGREKEGLQEISRSCDLGAVVACATLVFSRLGPKNRK